MVFRISICRMRQLASRTLKHLRQVDFVPFYFTKLVHRRYIRGDDHAE